jgi:hypothetical protein
VGRWRPPSSPTRRDPIVLRCGASDGALGVFIRRRRHVEMGLRKPTYQAPLRPSAPCLRLTSMLSGYTASLFFVPLERERAGARAGERERSSEKERKKGDGPSEEKRERERKSEGGSGWERERPKWCTAELGRLPGRRGAWLRMRLGRECVPQLTRVASFYLLKRQFLQGT